MMRTHWTEYNNTLFKQCYTGGGVAVQGDTRLLSC